MKGSHTRYSFLEYVKAVGIKAGPISLEFAWITHEGITIHKVPDSFTT